MPALRIARAIAGGYRRYSAEFDAITRAARARFENADWLSAQRASTDRLNLYHRSQSDVMAAIDEILDGAPFDAALWRGTKAAYAREIAALLDYELAETFFNSIYRVVTADADVDDACMFVRSAFASPPVTPDEPVYEVYVPDRDLVSTVKRLLLERRFSLEWQDLNRDVRSILRSLAEARPEIRGVDGVEIHILTSIFYRNKGAYLVGRIVYGRRFWPVVLPILVGADRRIYVDTLISDEDELSVVFSFTRAYFMVDAACPWAIVDFLQVLLPGKKRSELYASLGLYKHGKTEFYRGFLEHLEVSADELVIAPGVKGMVMTVFTLPSYQTVFKVIKDRFAPQKEVTRERVMAAYRLVKRHDRVGRMADTQEFTNFSLPRKRFSPELIAELLAVAAASVTIAGDRVVIRHLYTERLMTPLNLYVETAGDKALAEALDEYGNAIKQLAAANIFPGDMLLKNFGVTRHGRVVFYDYDEISYLTDVNFRDLPQPRTPEEEMSAEPWFTVGPRDVFPEEFRRFLFGRPGTKRHFAAMHGELFDPAYWRALQDAIAAGRVMDVFPYRRKKRFLRQSRSEVEPAKR